MAQHRVGAGLDAAAAGLFHEGRGHGLIQAPLLVGVQAHHHEIGLAATFGDGGVQAGDVGGAGHCLHPGRAFAEAMVAEQHDAGFRRVGEAEFDP